MTDEHVDQLLSEVRAALDVTPSPGFAAGVRARIADAPAPRRVAFWWPVVALASATTIVIAIAMMARGSSVPAAPTSARAVAVAPAVEPAPVATASASTNPVTPVAPVVPAAPRVVSRARARATTPASPAAPSLEVITNQGEVLHAMWRRARGVDRAFKEVEPEPATATTAGPVADPAQPIVLPPVTIDPIVISALGGSAGGGGAVAPGGPTIRRVDLGRNR